MSLGIALNKGVLKDFSFFSFLFFWACAGEGWALRCKQRELTPKNRAHLLVSSFFLFAVLVELVEEVVEGFEANEDGTDETDAADDLCRDSRDIPS